MQQQQYYWNDDDAQAHRRAQHAMQGLWKLHAVEIGYVVTRWYRFCGTWTALNPPKPTPANPLPPFISACTRQLHQLPILLQSSTLPSPRALRNLHVPVCGPGRCNGGPGPGHSAVQDSDLPHAHRERLSKRRVMRVDHGQNNALRRANDKDLSCARG
jgi:hypothetical protein